MFRMMLFAFCAGTLFAVIWVPLGVAVFFFVLAIEFIAEISGALTLVCPYCGKRVKMGAHACHHCGRYVN